MVEILALVLQHDEDAVLCAVGDGPGERRSDQDPYPEPAAPAGRWKANEQPADRCAAGPDLAKEPRADVGRYDTLRG